jgi:hypothetical protein
MLAMAAQGIYQSSAGAPWWVTLAIVSFPGVFAIILTMAGIIIWRRVNRADGNPPLKASRVMGLSIGLGVLFGPLCQFGFQRLTAWLTGQPVLWELVLIAPFVTGIGSMVAYEILRLVSRNRWPGLYAIISVKHSSAEGHSGDTPPGDLTVISNETRE